MASCSTRRGRRLRRARRGSTRARLWWRVSLCSWSFLGGEVGADRGGAVVRVSPLPVWAGMGVDDLVRGGLLQDPAGLEEDVSAAFEARVGERAGTDPVVRGRVVDEDVVRDAVDPGP